MQFSPASVKDVVRALVALAEVGATGLFNLGGPQAFSGFELLEMLVCHIRVHMLLVTDITSCSIHDFGFAKRRPLRTSPDSRKAYTALDFSFQTNGFGLCRGSKAVRASARHVCPCSGWRRRLFLSPMGLHGVELIAALTGGPPARTRKP
jgi:hypothetical protein